MRHFEIMPISGKMTVQTEENMIVWLLMEGTGTVQIGGAEYRIQSGAVIAQNPGFTIRFSMDTDGIVGKVCYKTTGRPKKITVLYAEQSELLFRTFDYAFSMERMITRIPKNNKIDGAVRETVQDLLQLFKRVLTISGLSVIEVNPMVEKICVIIEKNYTDPDFNLMEEIRKTGYSGAHFRRCFRSETGRAPLEHLRMRRITYAKELLRKENGISISEVALRSGFRDQSTFTWQFKKQEGITPSEYRREFDNME